jgi:hypothetical protein
MNRHQSFGGRHLGPVADAADMPGIAQRHRGEARRLALLDTDPDRLRRDGLPVTELAVDHRQRGCIDHDIDSLVGHDRAHLLPPDIDRHPDHAVAVMAGEVGGGEIRRDALGFLRRGFRMSEHVRNEVDEFLKLYCNHRDELSYALTLA